jgi:hypothetical protein
VTKRHRRAYRILGVPPGTPQDDVKQAYRDLAQVWHPDRFSHSDRLQAKAQRNLKRINEAYALLKDYEPEVGVRPSRLSMTMSAVMDLGDIMQSREIHRGPESVRQPPDRHRNVVLGVGDFRATGARRSRRRNGRWRVGAMVGILLLVAAAVLFQLV